MHLGPNITMEWLARADRLEPYKRRRHLGPKIQRELAFCGHANTEKFGATDHYGTFSVIWPCLWAYKRRRPLGTTITMQRPAITCHSAPFPPCNAGCGQCMRGRTKAYIHHSVIDKTKLRIFTRLHLTTAFLCLQRSPQAA